jgi:hypothetical protein
LNTAANSINSFNQTISKVFGPIAALYLKAFNYNKYLAGSGFAAFITLGLFFLMVALINLGDNSIPTDNSRKLGDVIMPDRDIDTMFDDVEKPEEPEEQPEDMALMLVCQNQKLILQAVVHFLEMVSTYHYLKLRLSIQGERKSEE